MPSPRSVARPDGLILGRHGVRALHASLLTHAPDHALTVLQETGYAAGEGVWQAYQTWLPAATGIARPEDVDAGELSAVLSRFFREAGWGTLTVTPLDGGALALDSSDWAEAEPGTASQPMCFLSSGMLADFLGRLSGEAVGVMEVECRSRQDARCRFLSALPDKLQHVYEAMAAGQTYEEALSV
jgi:predicted hydrocarbon binding protein